MMKTNSAGMAGIKSNDPQKLQEAKNIHEELADTITAYRKTISSAQPGVVNNSTWLLFTGPQAA